MEYLQDKLTPINYTKKEVKLRKPYSHGTYNVVKGDMQAIRISEGCPHNCPYCAEPTNIKWFGIPEIVRNKVLIYDMNILAKEESINALMELGQKKVNGKRVAYEFTCGIDYRFLTEEIADILYKNRFGRFTKTGFYKGIRIAWDWYMNDQYKIKDALRILQNVGYKQNNIMIFMICNWKIPYNEVKRKMDICKVWNVQIGECWYDNQKRGSVTPIHWTQEECNNFGKLCRKHNQLVSFGIDPEQKG